MIVLSNAWTSLNDNLIAPVSTSINDNLITPGQTLGRVVFEDLSYLCKLLDKEVELLTNHYLARSLAIIVQEAFRALPVALVYFYISVPMRAGIWLAYQAVHLFKPELLTCTTAYNTHRGLSISAAVEVVYALTLFAMTNEIINVATSLIAIPVSAYYHSGRSYYIEGMRREVEGQTAP